MKRLLTSSLAFAIVIAAAALTQQPPPSAPGSGQQRADPASDRSGHTPRYFKGNLHTHSFWSDGDDFPEMVAAWYKSHGYDFLALTDHNVLSDGERWIDVTPKMEPALEKYLERFGRDWVEVRRGNDGMQVRLKPLREFRSLLEEPGKFLLIPGEEISASAGTAPVHVNGINLRDVIPPARGTVVAEVVDVNIRAVAAQRTKTGWPMIAVLNHPNFGWAIRAEDMVLSEALRFFEVFNGHPVVRNYGDAVHASTERIWDIVLALRLGKYKLPLVYGLATDDAHGYHEFGYGKVNPGRGWVMVRAARLTAEHIVRGLEAGDFYASSGVRLEAIERHGRTLSIRIAGESGVTYKTQFIATMKNASFDSMPVIDMEGKERNVTRLYSDQIGKVVAESDALNPTYQITGDELYVRAKITSSKPHPNPYAKGDVECAWVQPILP